MAINVETNHQSRFFMIHCDRPTNHSYQYDNIQLGPILNIHILILLPIIPYIYNIISNQYLNRLLIELYII